MRILFVISTLIPSCFSVCGQPICNPAGNLQTSYFPPVQTYQPYQQQQQQQAYQQPPSQQQQIAVHPPTFQYYYPTNSYAVAPQAYDDFEKELEKLKPAATIIKTEDEDNMATINGSSGELKATIAIGNATSGPSQAITYIREYSPYAPDAYLRPLPYRPMPYIPKGCPVIPPQYIRPAPYYPRGYVQPAVVQPQIYPGAYVTPPVVQPPRPAPILPPPINDCCGRCGAPCKFRSRKSVIALASKLFTAEFVPRREKDEEDEPKDPKCNSEKLKDLMDKYITRTVSLSKRLIQKNAESEFGGYFSVICSTDDFSYVARSETFCQHQKNDILCYAFKHK
ncbi:unnamed protein product [Caenorhabditis bovis]|uniref:Ground-like domain-containing protein n=1 Tax=Caenorhabditis bovis TaxID=2654633 RepID=A0A8S1ED89_9PELO|nr:unnamed protein product [Caenorhabditis bovis]